LLVMAMPVTIPLALGSEGGEPPMEEAQEAPKVPESFQFRRGNVQRVDFHVAFKAACDEHRVYEHELKKAQSSRGSFPPMRPEPDIANFSLENSQLVIVAQSLEISMVEHQRLAEAAVRLAAPGATILHVCM